MVNSKEKISDEKSKRILELEKQVEIGVWIQVVGQIIELHGLSKIAEIEEETTTEEKKIIIGVWIQTIGHILIAISVSRQIRETDELKLLEEQKLSIAGDFLVSLGAAINGTVGLRVLENEIRDNYFSIVP